MNIRILTATNRDLQEMVSEGIFREDLFYRINVLPITTPPLRDRGSDIVNLADHFVTRFAQENGRKMPRISTPALQMLMNYLWPGNVRELENVTERAVVLCDDDVIHSYNLPPSLQGATLPGTVERSNLDSKIAVFTDEQGQIVNLHGPGVFRIFEKTADGWDRGGEIPFSVSDGAGLAEMKRALARLETELGGVQAVIVTELRGILCASLSAMGIAVWKSDGTLAEQLALVEGAMRWSAKKRRRRPNLRNAEADGAARPGGIGPVTVVVAERKMCKMESFYPCNGHACFV